MEEPQGLRVNVLMAVKAAPHAVKISFLQYHPEDHSQEVRIRATFKPKNHFQQVFKFGKLILKQFFTHLIRFPNDP